MWVTTLAALRNLSLRRLAGGRLVEWLLANRETLTMTKFNPDPEDDFIVSRDNVIRNEVGESLLDTVAAARRDDAIFRALVGTHAPPESSPDDPVAEAAISTVAQRVADTEQQLYRENRIRHLEEQLLGRGQRITELEAALRRGNELVAEAQNRALSIAERYKELVARMRLMEMDR